MFDQSGVPVTEVADDGGVLSPHWEDSLERFQDLVRAATS